MNEKKKKKFYSATWFMWLALILVPPLGLILLWVVNKSYKGIMKALLTVLFILWIPMIVAFYMVLSSGNNLASKEPKAEKVVEVPEVEMRSPVEEKIPEVVESTETMGQKNALADAINYLDYMGFSYKGLIEQLEFESYSKEDATYGVDNCGADWNAQAILKAKSYLDFTPFSEQGLIEQLVYDGFTQEQAAYGVSMNGY